MRALVHARPPLAAGIALACALIAVETLAAVPARGGRESVSLGVVYLVGVLLVAIVWGAWLGVATSLVSAAAFNFFHIPPTGRFTIADAENWVALVVFLITAVVAAGLAEAARLRAQEAEQRKREADLAAELARVLLGAADLPRALGPAAQRIAQALGLRSCRIVLEAVGDDRPLRRRAADARRRAARDAARAAATRAPPARRCGRRWRRCWRPRSSASR